MAGMWPIKMALIMALSVSWASEHGGGSGEGHAGASEKKSEAAAHETHGVEINARTSSRDVMLPKALVERLEREYKAFLSKAEGVHNKEEIKRSLINMSVEMSQKRVAALREDMTVRTPTGGGVIDLAELVTPVRGAFRVKIMAKKENGEELVSPHVYFVSHARTRTLAGEKYGDGCGRFMEITSAFHKKWERDGFEVFTADQRYVSVLGGTFIFVENAKEALYVGSVTFTDSRYAELLCE